MRPHDLRRHAATYASRSGVPIEIVSKVILRHANLSTTQRYLGKISDTEATRWIDLDKAWIAAGCPEPKGIKLPGGFEEYGRVIGGILEVAGIKGFLGNTDEFYESSDATEGIFKEFCCYGRSYLTEGSRSCNHFEDTNPVNDEEDGILRF
jgi:hypothetical protein